MLFSLKRRRGGNSEVICYGKPKQMTNYVMTNVNEFSCFL